MLGRRDESSFEFFTVQFLIVIESAVSAVPTKNPAAKVSCVPVEGGISVDSVVVDWVVAVDLAVVAVDVVSVSDVNVQDEVTVAVVACDVVVTGYSVPVLVTAVVVVSLIETNGNPHIRAYFSAAEPRLPEMLNDGIGASENSGDIVKPKANSPI